MNLARRFISMMPPNASVRLLPPLRQSAAKVIALICLCAVAQARDPIASSQALIFSEGGNSIPYRLFEPAGSIAAGTPVPLILFLHGAGERGTNNTSQVAFHIQGLIDRTELGSSAAYLIAPQAAPGQSWSGTPLRLALDLVEQFKATHNVDETRIYITGLSLGGFGAYAALAERPGLFAAAVPMSAGGGTALAAIYAQTPLWDFHGASDTVVPVTSSRTTIAAIQTAGGTRERYTELAGQGHVIWGPIYNGSSYNYDTNYTGTYVPDGSGDVYSWLFSQRQVPEPGTAAMLLASATMLATRRRRKRPPIGRDSDRS